MMGWSFESISTDTVPEKKLCSLIGEALHLGCVGTVLLLAFLCEGPWWPAGPRLAIVNSALPVVDLTGGQDQDPGVAPQPKRVRRTGCLRMRPSQQ
jgi:hypothetical protein